MENIDVEEYAIARRQILREIATLSNYLYLVYPPEQDRELLRTILTLLDYARLICKEIIKMGISQERNHRVAARRHFQAAYRHSEGFLRHASVFGVSNTIQYEFLACIIDDFPDYAI